MAKKKEEKISGFWYDCIWMSIRYALGRHTIASHSHAGNIAKYCYGKFETEERQEFTAYDINRELESYLRIYFSFFVDERTIGSKNYRPYDLFLEFLTKENITTIDELNMIDSVHLDLDTEGNIVYDIRRKPEGSNSGYRGIMDVHDCIIWQQLADCLNREHHKKVKLVDGSEEECFETWTEGYIEGQQLCFKKILIPVKSFCENSTALRYIREDVVVSVEDYDSRPVRV